LERLTQNEGCTAHNTTPDGVEPPPEDLPSVPVETEKSPPYIPIAKKEKNTTGSDSRKQKKYVCTKCGKL